jgi:GntR family transcriptional regulator
VKPIAVIDARSAIPVYQQIKQEIRRRILADEVKPGEQLIPIRELAKELSVNPNTIVKVYYQLEVEGFIQARPGQGYFVSVRDTGQKSEDQQALFLQYLDDFLHRLGQIGFGVDDLMLELQKKKGIKEE